ncbi:hypothetical protein [Pontibacillus yanchengensis]|uniref:Uncharacterized protein n=1 Tax=Pontibacillus yanchengensis Y32 TaxID=1385514 RepID=A0A0A2TAF9_9BACI|nr:hypothetical protein [Pontibacillus yanchengensis]KGP71378.1 hypothetical protein N782_19745 [Pontibacillus yanchengensis Y32]
MQSKKPIVPLENREEATGDGVFLDGFPFAGFPFGASGDLVWGVFGTLFYPPFFSPTFPYSANFPGPYPYGCPPVENRFPEW